MSSDQVLIKLAYFLFPQQTMHDIFDTEFSDELASITVLIVWSQLPQDLISRMVESAENVFFSK